MTAPTKTILTLTKDTKHMHKYELVIPDDVRGGNMYATIHIHKENYKGGEVPQEIEITITPVWK